jgi:hypothetical protein
MTFGDRGRESAPLGNFRTRRQTDICEMPRYCAVLSGVHGGQIVEGYQNSSRTHGFLYSDGVYTTLDYPSGAQTQAWRINNAGQIVGSYQSGNFVQNFVYSGGVYTTLNLGVSSAASGINDFCVEGRAFKVFSTDLKTKSL